MSNGPGYGIFYRVARVTELSPVSYEILREVSARANYKPSTLISNQPPHLPCLHPL